MGSKDKHGNPKQDVDKRTAKGKGEGGFSPHPGKAEGQEFSRGDRAKEEARQVTPAGKARSK